MTHHRCRSWRPTDEAQRTPGIKPYGRTNALAWNPCRSRITEADLDPAVVAAGVVRCGACYDALASCMSDDVRLALASESALPPRIVAWLASDPDPSVRDAALAHNTGSETTTTGRHPESLTDLLEDLVFDD